MTKFKSADAPSKPQPMLRKFKEHSNDTKIIIVRPILAEFRLLDQKLDPISVSSTAQPLSREIAASDLAQLGISFLKFC